LTITGMNHFTVLTDDVGATVAFYRNLLGLAEGPRPPLGFPGAWLYAGGQAVLHVVGGRPRGELRAGVIDHIAFRCHGLQDMMAQLKRNNVDFTQRMVDAQGLYQLFLVDPNGVKVELNFANTEAQGLRPELMASELEKTV